ncbi:MAG: hypothetical protein OXH03_04245, partial [Bacteroidetes bacterium]|nr:hypothetical protein [Bacteroidota bacterium]MDE2671057.1 hypothetical protein [Bacteroidota bacterium]
ASTVKSFVVGTKKFCRWTVDAIEQVVITIYLQQTAPDPVNGALSSNHWKRDCRRCKSLATG